MSDTQESNRPLAKDAATAMLDMKFEFIVLPVTDAERAKAFYLKLGWKIDMDFSRGKDFRVIQFTPPGSATSIIFGKGIPAGTPGSSQGLYLVVSDIVAARASLRQRGIDVGELFHDEGGVFYRADGEGRVTGAAPQRRSYGTFASFSDPDGNGWVMQEITVRLPGHGPSPNTAFGSPVELAGALRRAKAAHEKLQEKVGLCDEDWPTWYADYMVLEQAGKPLPT